MTLADYMSANGLDQTAFASRLGTDQGTVSKILRRGTASVGLALKVEKITSGRVTAESLNDDVAAARRGMRAA